MKRTNLLIVLLIANLSLISCTAERLEEATGENLETYADGGEDDPIDPEEEPIGK